jgi:hypothetical protein
MKCSICKTEIPEDAIFCSLGHNWYWSVACQSCTQQPREYYDWTTIRWKRQFGDPKPCNTCGRLVAKPTDPRFQDHARRFCSNTCESSFYRKPKWPTVIYCHQCGKRFKAKRNDAKYCSGKCRVQSHRKRNETQHGG